MNQSFNCLHVLRLTSQMHLIICVTSSDSLSGGHPDNQLKTTEWLSFAPPGSYEPSVTLNCVRPGLSRSTDICNRY